MKNKQNDKLLKIISEGAREAIFEYDGGDDGIGPDQSNGYAGLGLQDAEGYGGAGGYNNNSSGKNSLAGIFLDPLLDIGKTAMWGAKTLSSKLKYSIKSIAKGLFQGLSPNLSGDSKNSVGNVFDKIKQEELKDLGNIDKEFADVLKRNIEVLQGNDVWGISFLLNPGALIAAKLLQKAPGASIELLDSLTGGSATQAIQGISNTLREDLNNGKPTEQDAKKAWASKVVQDKLKSSESVKKLGQLATKILIDRAKGILLSKTKEELSTFLKKDINKLIIQFATQNKINQENIPKFENEIIRNIKEEFKENYISGLNQMLSQNPQGQLYINQAINAIKQLKY